MQHLRIASLLLFGMVVFAGMQTAVADVQYSFTTIDVPGALLGFTTARGINDSGQVSGYFLDAALLAHGFLYSGGSFTTIDVPGANGNGTFAAGINNSGQIVGNFFMNSVSNGFLDTGGSFTTINVPATSSTSASGINNSGEIVGEFIDATGTGTHGFLYSSGSFTTIDNPFPGNVFTALTAINDSGQILGNGNGTYLIVAPYSSADFTRISVPGAASTIAVGINDSGQIVGSYTDAAGQFHGFIDTAGSFATIDVPGAPFTELLGINNGQQLVGNYADAAGQQHGFLATPIPEPRALPVLATCLIGLFATMACRRKRV